MMTTINPYQRRPKRLGSSARVCALHAWVVAIAACSGGSSAVNPLLQSPALPGDAATATSNTYSGTQAPGFWSLTIDNTSTAFSYLPITNAPTPNLPVQGNFALQDGIENFGTNASGISAGMAVELTGRSSVLRPGNNTTQPIAMVNPTGCFPVTGRVRFIYFGLQPNSPAGNRLPFDTAYGTLVVSTSSDGKSWVIGDQRNYQATAFGGNAPGTANETQVPTEYNATCAVTNGQATIKADANAVFAAPPSFLFNSAGYFVEDLTDTPALNTHGYAGFIMPSAPLSAKDITSYSYRGIVYEPGVLGVLASQPMRLDPLTGSSALTGGVYPNDDPTATAGSQFTISLGKQDAALFGVFTKATLTETDPSGECQVLYDYYTGGDPTSTVVPPVETGFDANGVPTCTTEGVAVVGKPEDKYVIYFTGADGTTNQSSSGNAFTLQMYLYQQ